MAMKVNYGLQRAERDRAKQAKKEAKQRDRAAQAAATANAPEPAAELPEADEEKAAS